MKNKESVSYESYQEMAEYYYEKVDEKPFNAYYERPGLIELIPDVEGKNVLDAGCAAGWFTEWLIKHGADVTAVDFSPNMIEMTRKRVGDEAKIIRADLNEPLEFLEDKSMDLVISSLTLHYLKDWDNIMKEFNRVLGEKCCLVFSVHHPFMDYSYFDVDDYFETKLLKDEWGEPKVEVEFYRRPLNEIIRPVTDNGFVIEKVTEPMPTEKFREKVPEAYERLTKNPQFLFVRARKK